MTKLILKWTFRFLILLILYYVFFIGGSFAISGLLPDAPSEPGLLPGGLAMLLIGLCNTLIVMGLILSSRWYGWKLAIILSLAYYGAVTFVIQIESWYFLSEVTIDEKLLSRLFIMGLPVAFIYIPLSVFILGKGKADETIPNLPEINMSPKQWALKLGAISIIYTILYWSAGYFIAWQNPTLREFYGSPGDIIPFWEHTSNTLSSSPDLFFFQIFRGLLWAIFAFAVIKGSKLNVWYSALLVGLFLTLPQTLGLIIENPLMPSASVRLSHLIEGWSTNFIFGVIIVWLLHRKHNSVKDLFGIS